MGVGRKLSTPGRGSTTLSGNSKRVLPSIRHPLLDLPDELQDSLGVDMELLRKGLDAPGASPDAWTSVQILVLDIEFGSLIRGE